MSGTAAHGLSFERTADHDVQRACCATWTAPSETTHFDCATEKIAKEDFKRADGVVEFGPHANPA